MRNCYNCEKKIARDEICYRVEVVKGTGENPNSGAIERVDVICENCYFRMRGYE